MEKTYLLIIAIVVVIILGFIYKKYNESKSSTSTSSTKYVNASKTVVVRDVDYINPILPPPHYNRYKAQYY
jgi:hypothetical protein